MGVVHRRLLDRVPHIAADARVANRVLFARGAHQVLNRRNQLFDDRHGVRQVVRELRRVALVGQDLDAGLAVRARERLGVAPPVAARRVAHAVRLQRRFVLERFDRADVARAPRLLAQVVAPARAARVLPRRELAVRPAVDRLRPQPLALDGADGRVVPGGRVDVESVGVVLGHDAALAAVGHRRRTRDGRRGVGDFRVGGHTELVDRLREGVVAGVHLLEAARGLGRVALVEARAYALLVGRLLALAEVGRVVPDVPERLGEIGCAVDVAHRLFGREEGVALFLALVCGRHPRVQRDERGVAVRVQVLLDVAPEEGHHIVVGELVGADRLPAERLYAVRRRAVGGRARVERRRRRGRRRLAGRGAVGRGAGHIVRRLAVTKGRRAVRRLVVRGVRHRPAVARGLREVGPLDVARVGRRGWPEPRHDRVGVRGAREAWRGRVHIGTERIRRRPAAARELVG